MGSIRFSLALGDLAQESVDPQASAKAAAGISTICLTERCTCQGISEARCARHY
jgi:hypothetical protein